MAMLQNPMFSMGAMPGMPGMPAIPGMNSMANPMLGIPGMGLPNVNSSAAQFH